LDLLGQVSDSDPEEAAAKDPCRLAVAAI
jgi:hypothetical protein